jgi:hypothetical protein
MRRAAGVLAIVVLLAAGVLGASATVSAAAGPPENPTPVLAYYYIWFTPSSWNRAKRDYPLLGRYSSDEVSVMRRHIRMAKQAGIDGFIVSWKSSPVLDERLEKLIDVAEAEHFGLSIMYQGLDFERRPLPVDKVAFDIDLFATRYARSPVFHRFGLPVFVWSGTWKFTPGQVRRALAQHRHDLRFLASERNPRDYARKASLFDGDAYYWSSVNPDTYPGYQAKLDKMADAVHATGGLWFAPAAPGFDARMVGGTTTVGRAGGDTLRRQLTAAQASDPDAIGLISWNEFSENSHLEPSERYGAAALEALGDALGAKVDWDGEFDSSAPGGRQGGLGSIAEIVAFLGLLVIGIRTGRRRRRRVRGDHDDRHDLQASQGTTSA